MMPEYSGYISPPQRRRSGVRGRGLVLVPTTSFHVSLALRRILLGVQFD